MGTAGKPSFRILTAITVSLFRIDNGNRRNEGYTGDITWERWGDNSWGNYHNNYSANGGLLGRRRNEPRCSSLPDTIVTQLRNDHRRPQTYSSGPTPCACRGVRRPC